MKKYLERKRQGCTGCQKRQEWMEQRMKKAEAAWKRLKQKPKK